MVEGAGPWCIVQPCSSPGPPNPRPVTQKEGIATPGQAIGLESVDLS